MKQNWREVLSWQLSFGEDNLEAAKNTALMQALTDKGIPFQIGLAPGSEESYDNMKVLIIGDGGVGTLYTAMGFNGYFIDTLDTVNIIRDEESLDKIIDNIEFYKQ
jgi:hypothetical protein